MCVYFNELYPPTYFGKTIYLYGLYIIMKSLILPGICIRTVE